MFHPEIASYTKEEEETSHTHTRARALAALNAACSSDDDCTGANQACLSLVCECVAGYYESDSTSCSIVPAGSYPGESITYSSTSLGRWYGVAASTNFRTIVATVYNGNIYKSTNSGVSWVALTGAGSRYWRGIACNTDCSKMTAVSHQTGYGGNIWLSTNGGVNWSTISGAGSRQWMGITASADFTDLLATVEGGQIWRSKDSGASWTVVGPSFSTNWFQIAANGAFDQFVAASSNPFGDYLYKSLDDGATWNSMAPLRNWYGICVSADFTHMAATSRYTYLDTGVYEGGSPWVSHDSGVSWSYLTSAGGKEWRYIAATADLSLLVSVDYNGRIYHSVYDGPIAASTVWNATGPVTQLALAGGGYWLYLLSCGHVLAGWRIFVHKLSGREV